jgi:oxalate decarboxylase/phosphoglucose isomerase-like protein (cupin superfamily)
LQITINWDSSTAKAPIAFKTAINYVVRYLDQLITTPISISIDVGWGEVDGFLLPSGALGASLQFGSYPVTYNRLVSALTESATSNDDFTSLASFGPTDPSGIGQYTVPLAEADALGLISGGTLDAGSIGFSSTAKWNFSTTTRGIAGLYDFVGVVEHEITEILGRVSGLNSSSGPTPMDVFRYAAPGVRDVAVAPSSGKAYFSIDGGKTDLGDYNLKTTGDIGDWAANMGPDAFLAFTSAGVTNDISANDIRLLDVMGYTLSTTPPAPVSTYTLSPNPATVNENAGTLTLTVTRSNTTEAATVFAVTTGDIYGAGYYYTSLKGVPVAFAVGQATATISIPIIDHNLTASSQSFNVLVVKDPVDLTSPLASEAVTILENDDPGTFTIAPNPVSVSESVGTVTFTITRSNASIPITVYAFTDQDHGIGNPGNEYYTEIVGQPVSFTVGQTTAQVTLNVNNLELSSGSESFDFNVRTSLSDTSSVVASDTFTIVNDAVTTYSVSPSPAAVNEGGLLTLTVVRNNTAQPQTLYAYTVQDQGTTGQYYYQALNSQPVSFTYGQASATVSIPISDLGLTSGSESFSVVFATNFGSIGGSAVAKDVFTIYNNDGTTYTLSPSPASVNENAGTLTLTVTRSNTDNPSTVYVSTVDDQGTSNGTTGIGVYYTNLLGQTVSFAAGQATATVSIAVKDLGLQTGSESFRAVVLNNPGDAPSNAVASDVFTIVNNDTPPVTYSLSPNPATVNENGGTLTLTVTRSSSTSAGTVYVSTVADQGFNNNSNYTSLNAQPVNFIAGQSTATVSIGINDLGITLGSESYRAVVLPTATSPVSAAVASDVFTILNNDPTGPATTYVFSPNPASVNENAGTLSLTLERSGQTPAGTVYITTIADQGSANNGNFTSLTAKPVTFIAGQGNAPVFIPINDLGLTSGSETYRVVVLPTATSPLSAALASDTFTIVNNDPPVNTLYQFTPSPAAVNENAGTLTLTVSRSTMSTAATVYVSTVADQGFANNGNYTNLVAQPVTFTGGQATANVTIPINDLGLTSGSENYRVVVLPAANSQTSAALASDIFSIVNNDVAPPPVTYSLSPNPASVNENAGTLTLTVTRSSSASAGTVYVSTVADQGFANNGNYTNLNAQAVSFIAGQTTASVSIAVNDLGLTSGSENYRAVVLPTASSATSAAVASDVFTIVNNDVAAPPPVTYSLSPNPASVNENAGTLTLTVTRSSAASAGTVYVSTLADQGFANNGNYTSLTAQAVTFAAGQSTANVAISIKDLGLTSGSETYRAVVLPTASSPTSAAVASDVFTIVNNDVATPPPSQTFSLTPSPAKVNESGKAITFTLTRTNTSVAQTVYASTLTDQGYANNGNFKGFSNLAVTFAAGQATASVSVLIVDLGLTSGSETYRLIVTQTPSAPASSAVASDTFTIINNDGSTGGRGGLSQPAIPDFHGFWSSGQRQTDSPFATASPSLAGNGGSLLGSPGELLKRSQIHFAVAT